MFQVNNKDQNEFSNVLVSLTVNLEQISHIVHLFSLLTLNKYMLTGKQLHFQSYK